MTSSINSRDMRLIQHLTFNIIFQLSRRKEERSYIHISVLRKKYCMRKQRFTITETNKNDNKISVSSLRATNGGGPSLTR